MRLTQYPAVSPGDKPVRAEHFRVPRSTARSSSSQCGHSEAHFNSGGTASCKAQASLGEGENAKEPSTEVSLFEVSFASCFFFHNAFRELYENLERAGDVTPWKTSYEEESYDEVYWAAHNASCYKVCFWFLLL